MTVYQYPGNFRVGVLFETTERVQEEYPAQVEPKDMLFVLLNGYQRFRIDAQVFEMSASPQRPVALLLRVEQPAELEYFERRGDPLVKLAISTDPDWLDLAGLIDAPMRSAEPLPVGQRLSGHLAHRSWQPDAGFVRRCQDIVDQVQGQGHQAGQPESARLFLMARGIDLYREALAGNAAAPLENARHPKLFDIEVQITRHLSDHEFTPEHLARACGMSLRSLQRLCRDALGCSPRDHIRERRLRAAREALQDGSVSVAQAAWIAGYSSAANFNTAFKRTFGTTPGHFARRPAAGGARC